MIKVSITRIKTYSHFVPPDTMRRAQNHFCGILAKNAQPQSNYLQIADEFNWVTFYKIPSQYSSKVSWSWKTNKWGTATDWRRLRWHDNWIQCETLDWILHQLKDISRTTGEIWIISYFCRLVTSNIPMFISSF